ncbi:MAG: alanine--glyoxylate aminotransferase family protein [Anaerolineales bacterium]|jgi:predicted phosphoserine aminotransferase
MTKLFLPGPVDVAPEVLQAQAQDMIGHRSAAFAEIMGRVQPLLRTVLGTSSRVYISTSSGTGLQEAAVRNVVQSGLLVCVCGAFGERWFDVAQANGLPADRLDSEWGQPNRPEQVLEAFGGKHYDAVALVHNETSTGVQNPVGEIAEAVRSISPDTLILVDAVSSAGGVSIPFDAWGLDVLLTSSQKCFALPPGLSFAAVSDRALERAREVPERGWYFDFLLFEQYLERNATPTTPAVSLIFALECQLKRMMAEGLEERYARHASMAEYTRDWAQTHFSLFAAQGYRSNTVTTIRSGPKLEVPQLIEHLAGEGISIANGYGRLKNETFRIGHMGETTLADLRQLTSLIDAFLPQGQGKQA